MTQKTKSVWFPERERRSINADKVYKSSLIDSTPSEVRPRHPIYVISKGRSRHCLTACALDKMNVSFFLVVEESEQELYQKSLLHFEHKDQVKVLTLPQRYLDEYDTCDELGETKSKGPGAARNFCWDHAVESGAQWHWVMDDNFRRFTRLNRNKKHGVGDATIFRCMEDFCARYKNVAIAGPNYEFFCKERDALPAFVKNTRIYSCLLIKNSLDMRWRGRYNEDTDLSLRVLKKGLCTVQFNAFLGAKVGTQSMKGGNTAEFYEKEGTKEKSEMLARLHPDVARVAWKFQRWHHEVNYSSFKDQSLVAIDESAKPANVDQYGMQLV